jgi:hypothetical protein
MKSIKREDTYTAQLDITTDADQVLTVYQVFVTLSHEWGDEVVEETVATRTGTGTYEYDFTATDLQSSGVHKIHWRYVRGGDTYTKDDYINIYQPYLTEEYFFDIYPELEDVLTIDFEPVENKVRQLIDTHCGQQFDWYPTKRLTLDGSGTRSLYLPLRLNALTSVTNIFNDIGGSTTEDVSDYVQLSYESKFFIQMKSTSNKFSQFSQFRILGDWGWPYVPQHITDAAALIMADLLNDDSIYRQHGVSEVYMDTHRMRFDSAIFGSTGNLDADVLLMDYNLFLMTII